MRVSLKMALEKIILAMTVFYCVFFSIFVIFQLSIWGELKISYLGFRIIILILDIIYMLAVNKSHFKSKYHKFIFPLLLSCCASIVFGTINYGLVDSLGVFTDNILFIFIIYTFGTDNKSIKIRKIFKILYLFGVINAVFCIIQFFSKSVLLPDLTINGESVYESITYFGIFVRACGFFFSGLDVGIIMTFSLLYLLIIDDSFKIKKIFLSVLLLFAIYTTKTRNIYLLLIYLLLYFIIFHSNRIKNINKLKFFMVITSTISTLVVISASFGKDGLIMNNIFSSNSSIVRLLNWKNWFNTFVYQNPLYIMFGNCSSQKLGMTTDNMYMEYLSSFGILGLFLIVQLFIKIMKRLSTMSSKNAYIMTAFVACLFPFGVINLPSTFFMIYLPFLTSISSDGF